MFGLLRPCRHHLPPGLHQQWRSHLCGLCLALRDTSGQLARATTNVDAVVLSVLVEAQMADPVERSDAGRCPLRGMRSAIAISPAEAPARLGAAVSLAMGAAKLADHADDGDGVAGRLRGPARRLAARWERQGTDLAVGLGADTSKLAAEARRQAMVESVRERGVWDYAAPTARAAGEAFALTSAAAGMAQNAGPLRRAGMSYGRIVYLLDAVEDRVEDARSGRFNALDACAGDPDPADLFVAAHTELVGALAEVEMVRPELAHALLVHELARIGRRRTGASGGRCAAHARTAFGLGVAAAAIAAMPLPSGGDPLPPGLGVPSGPLPPGAEEAFAAAPAKRGCLDRCGDCCDCGDCCCCCDSCDGCDGCDCCDCDC